MTERSNCATTIDNKDDKIKIDDTYKNRCLFLFIVAIVCSFVA